MTVWLLLGLFPVLWLVLVLLNLLLWPRIMKRAAQKGLPKLSVLIPARNAAPTIGPCVESWLAQAYPEFELLLLDDHSTDGTGAIALAAAAGSDRFRRLRGRPLPEGWNGKSWACHQLAEAARGELLLFTEANTLAEPGMLARLVSTAQARRADLLTGIPRQQVGSFGGALLLAQRLLLITLTLPVSLVPRRGPAWLVAASGACLLVRRESYRRVGGHAAVRQAVAGDLALVRLIKRGRGRVLLCNLSVLLQARMAGSSGRAWRSVLHGQSIVGSLLMAVLHTLLFLVPPGALLLGEIAHHDLLALAGGTLAGLVIGLVSCRAFRLPLWLGLLMPLQALLAIAATLATLWRACRSVRLPVKRRRYA